MDSIGLLDRWQWCLAVAVDSTFAAEDVGQGLQSMNAIDREKVELFGRLVESLQWAMSKITEKSSSVSSCWQCPHCNGKGTPMRSGSIRHSLDCPWLKAKHVLSECEDPEIIGHLHDWCADANCPVCTARQHELRRP